MLIRSAAVGKHTPDVTIQKSSAANRLIAGLKKRIDSAPAVQLAALPDALSVILVLAPRWTPQTMIAAGARADYHLTP